MKFTILIFVFFISCTPPPGFYRSDYGGSFKNTRYYIKDSGEKRSYSSNRKNNYLNLHGKRRKIVNTAKRYIGVKYRYGGSTPAGFDCSGFVLYVYKKIGVKLPRSARNQYKRGKRIRISQAKPGDLIFFETSPGHISHVAIYLGQGDFIHSPSTGNSVRIDSVTNVYWKKVYIGTVSII